LKKSLRDFFKCFSMCEKARQAGSFSQEEPHCM
jgi:hypothetical protein